MPIAIENLADAIGGAGSALARVADALVPVTVQARSPTPTAASSA